MERRRNLLKKVLIYVLTVAVVLSNGMFMNLKKAKAETYYQAVYNDRKSKKYNRRNYEKFKCFEKK